MGIHRRQNEIEALRLSMVSKKLCFCLIGVAFLVGGFVGNAATVVYYGQKQNEPHEHHLHVQSEQNISSGQLLTLEKATQKNPANAATWIALGNYCFDKNFVGKAILAYERALELRPKNQNVWSDLGVMYRRNMQFHEALAAFEKAVELDSNNTTALFNMGVVYLHDLDDKERALQVWRSILQRDSNAQTPSGQSLSELVAGLTGTQEQ